MLFDRHLRREEAVWEVVDHRDVIPVPMWDEDEDLEIAYTHHANISYRFVHDLRAATDLRKAVQLARCQLLQDANRLKCNVLLSEGWARSFSSVSTASEVPHRWRCTLMRQGQRHRVEVVYSGRPARAMGQIARFPQPPFIGVLDHCEHHITRYQQPRRRSLFRTWSRTSNIST